MMVPVLPGSDWCGFYFYSNMLDNADITINDAQITLTWDKGNGGWLGNGGITPNVKAVESIQNVWHTVEILESGTVIFETKEGPYKPIDPKDIFHNE